MEAMLSTLQARLGHLDLGEREPREKVLNELTVEGVAAHIQKILASDDKRKVVVMTGAGISTAAGIPDFRSPGTGLYDNLQKYNLPSPQAVFEINYFQVNPKPFFHLAKELYPAKFKPTMSHYFIQLLSQKGLLLRNFTQNIDTLERRAGVADDLLVEAHGSFHNAHCITCHQPYSHDFVKDHVFRGELPLCERPGCAFVPDEGSEQLHRGLVKPDIVFFGEALPERFAKCVSQDMGRCDLLIIMGTSLKVHPFASLTDRVRDECPRLLINLEKVGQSDPLMVMLGMGGGLDFSEESGYRDVFMQSTCDEGCERLAQLLGWNEELKRMCKEDHQKIDAEIAMLMTELKEREGTAAATKKEDSQDKSEELPVQDKSEELPVQDNSEEVPVQDNSEELPVQDNSEELPVQDNSEELPVQDKSEELPVQDKSEELPVQDKSEELPVQDKSEELPVQDKSEELPVQVKSEEVPAQDNSQEQAEELKHKN